MGTTSYSTYQITQKLQPDRPLVIPVKGTAETPAALGVEPVGWPNNHPAPQLYLSVCLSDKSACYMLTSYSANIC